MMKYIVCATRGDAFIPYRDLRLKLKSQANFNEFSFKITSASTCYFRKEDFVYT